MRQSPTSPSLKNDHHLNHEGAGALAPAKGGNSQNSTQREGGRVRHPSLPNSNSIEFRFRCNASRIIPMRLITEQDCSESLRDSVDPSLTLFQGRVFALIICANANIFCDVRL